MRAFLFLLLTAVAVNGQGQNIADSFPVNERGQVEFTVIGEVNTVGMILYDRAISMLQHLFPSAKAATQEANRESGTLIVKGILPYSYYQTSQTKRRSDTTYAHGKAEIVLKVYCKDGKYKVSVSDIRLNGFYLWDGDQVISSATIEALKGVKDQSVYYSSLSRYAGFYYRVTDVLDYIKRNMREPGPSEF